MNLRIPTSAATYERHPCSECDASISFKVVRNIRTLDELSSFMQEGANQADCPACGYHVQAPVRIGVRIDECPFLAHDFIPYQMLADSSLLEELAKPAPLDVRQVFTINELVISIETRMHIEVRKLGLSDRLMQPELDF